MFRFLNQVITPNGPAIWGVCVGRRKCRAVSIYPEYSGPVSCHGTRRPWRGFWRHGTIFIGCRRGRGTNFLSGLIISHGTGTLKNALVQHRDTN
jgi:hypothetical protein